MRIGKYEVHRRYTAGHILVDIASMLLLIVLWVVTAGQVQALPALVPLYITASGAGKLLVPSGLLLLFPLFAMGVAGVSVWICFHPKNFDRRFDADVENAQPFYDIMVSMIGEIRLVVLVILLELTLGALQTAGGEQALPSFIALWCVVVIFVLVRIRKRQIKRIEYRG